MSASGSTPAAVVIELQENNSTRHGLLGDDTRNRLIRLIHKVIRHGDAEGDPLAPTLKEDQDAIGEILRAEEHSRDWTTFRNDVVWHAQFPDESSAGSSERLRDTLLQNAFVYVVDRLLKRSTAFKESVVDPSSNNGSSRKGSFLWGRLHCLLDR